VTYLLVAPETTGQTEGKVELVARSIERFGRVGRRLQDLDVFGQTTPAIAAELNLPVPTEGEATVLLRLENDEPPRKCPPPPGTWLPGSEPTNSMVESESQDDDAKEDGIISSIVDWVWLLLPTEY
jgi:hypothetical protein